MGSFGGFYKGEKKKKKKNVQKSNVSYDTPVFTHPEIVSKKKQQPFG